MTATAQPGTTHTGMTSSGGRVTQLRVLRSEWIKLRSLRSTGWTLLVAVVAVVGIGLLVSYVTKSHWAQIRPEERARFNPTDRSLSGVFLGQLAIGVLGVLVVTGEYATGSIRSTFAAVPRRLPVLWAKVAVYSAVAFVLMLASCLVAFLVGQQLLSPHGTTLSAPHVTRAIVGAVLYLTVVGVLGLALGLLIRSTAGAIATLVGILLVVPIIAQFLPASWQTDFVPYLPSEAGQAVFVMRPDPGMLAPWTGFAVFCAYAAVALAAAAVLVVRRDA